MLWKCSRNYLIITATTWFKNYSQKLHTRIYKQNKWVSKLCSEHFENPQSPIFNVYSKNIYNNIIHGKTAKETIRYQVLLSLSRLL